MAIIIVAQYLRHYGNIFTWKTFIIPVNWISFKLAAMLISFKYAVIRKESNLFKAVNRENNFREELDCFKLLKSESLLRRNYALGDRFAGQIVVIKVN